MNTKTGTNSKRFKAVYTPDTVGDGNPLIEALPPIMDPKTAIERLGHFPAYDEGMRLASNTIRYQYLKICLRFFALLGVHISLERRFSSAIRMSYWERNPAKVESVKQTENNVREFASGWRDPYNIQNEYVSTCAPGFNVVGISGCGKSQTTERILGTYPQVIDHREYNGQEFTESQIVYLKLDCPFDGSTKALCLNFFQKVDALLGTNYMKNYANNGTRSANAMIPYIATVAANHHLGILVIDEIQRLNSASSGGRKDMLNFFVQLVNTLGVAVVLIGTFHALDLLNGNFSQMRRGTGEGDLVWDRMSFDKNWNSFVRSLWQYQFTRNKCSLEDDPSLSKVLYEESQGITDLAIKLYIFTQERAIETGKEVITAGMIRSAARDKFQIIRPALDAFKNKDKKALRQFEDAYPTFLEKYLYPETQEEAPKGSPQNPEPVPSSLSPEIVGEIADEPEVRAAVNKSKPRRKSIIPPDKRKKKKSAQSAADASSGDNTVGADVSGASDSPAHNIEGSLIEDGVLGFGSAGTTEGDCI